MSLVRFQFEIDGMVRGYIVMLPDDWRIAGPMPVIVCLHGNDEGAVDMATKTYFHDTPLLKVAQAGLPPGVLPPGGGADGDDDAGAVAAEGLAKFITVYPEGAELDGHPTWNNDLANAAQTAASLHDVELLFEVLRRIDDELYDLKVNWSFAPDGLIEGAAYVPLSRPLDRSRLYLVGFSSGGFMVYKAAVNSTDATYRWAAVGVHSATIGGWIHSGDGTPGFETSVGSTIEGVHYPHSPRQHVLTFDPVHLLHIHGQVDQVAPPDPEFPWEVAPTPHPLARYVSGT